MMISQTFIFAAGRGERMRPLTDSIPKPLVKVKNKPIIDYIIEKLDKMPQINKIIINGYYLANQIEDHIKKLNNPKIIFSNEPSKIETGGGLLYAQDKYDISQPILLINGDILWQDEIESDIERLCEAYKSSDCDIMLGLKKTEEVLGYEGEGDFVFDVKNGDIFRFKNTAQTHVFVGIQVVNPQILNDVTMQCFSMNYFYKKAEQIDGKLNKIKGLELKGRYFHIGDVKALAAAEAAL